MNDFAHQLFPSLLWATLGLTLGTLVVWCLLSYARAVSPRVHRLAWCAALVAGWSFVRLPIEVPWYEPVARSEPSASSSELPLMTPLAPVSETLESPIESETVELSPGFVELSPEPAASAAGADAVELSQLPQSIYEPTSPPIPLTPLDATAAAAGVMSVEPPFWAEIDPWPTLAVFWIAGMGAIALAWLAGYLWFVFRLPVGRTVNGAWANEWRTLLATCGVRQPIPLCVTGSLGPMLCRLPLGYRLIVPEPLWRELDQPGRQAVLRHELAHYQRGDVWWSLVARLLALPQWFNPASWYCVRRFDEAAEWACDRAATAEQPVIEYARALLRLGTDAHGYSSYRPAAAGKPLAARIRRLLRLRNERDSTMKTVLLTAVAVLMIGVALVRVELVAREGPAQGVDFVVEVVPPAGATAAEKTPAVDGSAAISALPAVDPDDARGKAQAAANAAAKAYEAASKAYAEGAQGLDSVYTWSLRLMNAAERAPPEKKEGEEAISQQKARLVAAQEHLERMKSLHARVKSLFGIGAAGHDKMAAVDFYVAEAERIVAESAAELPQVSGELRLDAVSPPSTSAAPKATPMGGRPMAGHPMGRAPISIGRPMGRMADRSDPRRALRYDGKSFEQWQQVFATDLSSEAQGQAIGALAAFGARGYGPEVAQLLLEAPDDVIRWHSNEIVTAFSHLPRKEVEALVIRATKNDRREVKALAYMVLGSGAFDSQQVAEILERNVSDPELGSARALIDLARMRPDGEETQRALRAALRNEKLNAFETALKMAAGRIQPVGKPPIKFSPQPELAADIASSLSSSDPEIINLAVRALVRCGAEAKVAIPAVNPWLTGDDYQKREWALAIIEAVGTEAGEAVPALIELLKDCPRIEADESANFGIRVGGPRRTMTESTLAILGTIRPAAKAAVPAILELARTTRADRVKISAIKALGSIGPDAAEAVDFLEQTLNSAGAVSTPVRSEAREALKRIQPESK